MCTALELFFKEQSDVRESEAMKYSMMVRGYTLITWRLPYIPYALGYFLAGHGKWRLGDA